MSNSRKSRKLLTLHEVVEELEQNDEVEFPDSITIMPPENCNAEITDEDSGDEDFASIQYLPESHQLRAPAEIQQDSSDDSEDDNLLLLQLVKQWRIGSDDVSFSTTSLQSDSETNSSTQADEPIPSTSRSIPRLLTSKNNNYTWSSRDI